MVLHLRENAGSRQSQEQTCHEVDTTLHLTALLASLGLPKEISTSYGLNETIHMGWTLGDPHIKIGQPDVQDYEIAQTKEGEIAPGPDWRHLFRWLTAQAHEIIDFDSVYVITDNRDLVGSDVASQDGLAHWPVVAAWWSERVKYLGPYQEKTTVFFVPICGDTRLSYVHPTWAGTFILDACVYLFPTINFALIDSDCIPVTIFELEELWRSCDCLPNSDAEMALPHPRHSSPVAPAHKRARSVDTGRTAQQHGPPRKLSKSRSAENLAVQSRDRLPGSHSSVDYDYGGSDDDSSAVPSNDPPTSPLASSHSTGGTDESPHRTAPSTGINIAPAAGVLLVSEAFTEINAGVVIVLRSRHEVPVSYASLREPDRDSDDLAEEATRGYHRHVERYLATTSPPTDIEAAVSSGPLASPLLGTWTEFSADWCHAWSILGQWSSWVTFPVPQSGQWPQHGHLRGIAEGQKGRQPNFHKWARPAYEQGALPTLSLLQGDVAVRVLPGDKIYYQAIEIGPNYMRPVILYGFGAC